MATSTRFSTSKWALLASFAAISGAANAGTVHDVPAQHITIQRAIDAADSGDVVMIADGTYTGVGNRDIDFGGKAIVLLSASGDPALCVIDCEGDPNDPHRGFYFDSGETAETQVIGITVTNGYVTTESLGRNAGGGIFCDVASSPSFINCVITGNSAIDDLADGGGVYCFDGSEPTFTDCTISDNDAAGYAPDGGGVFCGSASNPTFTGCVISGNSAYGDHADGGGLFCDDGSSPILTNCTINGNTAGDYIVDGGGVLCRDNSNPLLINCTLSNNIASGWDGYGGGIYCDRSSPVLAYCTISDNEATQHGGGGFYYQGFPILDNCTIAGNSAFYAGGISFYRSNIAMTNCALTDNHAGLDGGGARFYDPSDASVTNCTLSGNSAEYGGGVICDSGGDPTFTNCSISGNTAEDRGGGVYCFFGSDPKFVNCAINGNSATAPHADGGGVCCYSGSHATLINCTLSGNSARQYSGGVHCDSSSPTLINCNLWEDTPQAIYVRSANPSVTYSNVQGGWPGVGNIDADPRFVDPDGPDNDPNTWEDNDYRVGVGSPCVDAGDNSVVPTDSFDLDGDGDPNEVLPFDKDGAPRFADDAGMTDIGVGTPPIVDIGAYEFQGQTCFGDLDGDSQIGLTDLATLLANYGTTTGAVYADGDLYRDGDVDLADLAALLPLYGAACP